MVDEKKNQQFNHTKQRCVQCTNFIIQTTRLGRLRNTKKAFDMTSDLLKAVYKR
jgi:hypothetical protein